MSIGVLLVLNSRGDMVLSRSFRDGFSIRQLAEVFRLEIIATKRAERCPVAVIDNYCFTHMRYENMFIICVSSCNIDVAMCFQFMLRTLQIFRSYFEELDEECLRENFVTAQQLLDEANDFGYPQITEVDLLKAFIGQAGAKGDVMKKPKESESITIKATGAIPWRPEGIVYRDNEVFLDVFEEVNLLMSQNGTVLQREIAGRIVMKAFLSGMPECRLVLNDRSMGAGAAAAAVAATSGAAGGAAGASRRAGVTLDDVSFHACVKLSDFEATRSICFVPPDGEFVLMRYRTSEAVNPPFRVVGAHIREVAKTRMEIDFNLKSEFDPKEYATDIVVKVPCPANTAEVKVRVSHGKAKYDAPQRAVLWKIKKMQGSYELSFSCEISLIAATLQTSEKVWSRPPIVLSFSVGVAVSGLRLESLKAIESKLKYTTQPWVRYQASAGQYECRL